ncbi:MAG: hypothetical protein WCR58_06270 [Bacteroidales bacterium]|jgi:hypothetical protein|nr:hypothetical protein [Bacteroidales bacterium]MDD3702237.1 hypothetical protein [Bacteroidales bacterium]MDY0368888.1 hypothetical protein [Bacteroidales bacterium]
MKKNVSILILFSCVFLFWSSGYSQEVEMDFPDEESGVSTDYGLSVGFKFGTHGLGGEACFQFHPNVHLRLGTTYFKYTQDLSQIEPDIQGEAFAKVGGVQLLANYYFGRPFFISAGALYNFFEIDMFGLLSESQTINGVEFHPEDIGRLEVNLRPGWSLTPYFGVGFGRTLAMYNKLSFAFELGIVYLDSPRVQLHTTGMLSPTSSAEQQQQLNENLAWLNLYPNISFQLSYRIF